MAHWETEQTVTQSVLERLIDRDPEMATDAPSTRAQSVRQLKVSLRRDLEWLLNTRRTPDAAPPSFPELYRSLFNFGLPDVTSLNRDRVYLLRQLEEVIALFEPRLAGVKVTPLEAPRGSAQVVRFQIEGLLRMDPQPEHISFDTVLQLSSGQYDVKGVAGA